MSGNRDFDSDSDSVEQNFDDAELLDDDQISNTQSRDADNFESASDTIDDKEIEQAEESGAGKKKWFKKKIFAGLGIFSLLSLAFITPYALVPLAAAGTYYFGSGIVKTYGEQIKAGIAKMLPYVLAGSMLMLVISAPYVPMIAVSCAAMYFGSKALAKICPQRVKDVISLAKLKILQKKDNFKKNNIKLQAPQFLKASSIVDDSKADSKIDDVKNFSALQNGNADSKLPDMKNIKNFSNVNTGSVSPSSKLHMKSQTVGRVR